jgi:hypothetical protein
MTWVIGLRSMFGYAAAISDVQVTWPSQGKTLDCLQKVYPIAPFMVAGFAGSVRIGFGLLEDLYRWVNFQRHEEEAVNTRIVAHLWWRRARRLFSMQRPELRSLGAQVLLAGVSIGEREVDAPWARSDVISLRSSEGFKPRYAKGLEALSVGSGSEVEEYIEALGGLHELIQAEVFNPGGFGFGLAMRLSFILRQHPRPGVSRHLILAIARQGDLNLSIINRTDFPPEGQPIEDPVPPIARSWEEFKRLASTHGLEAPSASA